MATLESRSSSRSLRHEGKDRRGAEYTVIVHVPVVRHVVTVMRERGNSRDEYTFVYVEEQHALVLDHFQVSERQTRRARFFPVRWCSKNVYGDGSHSHKMKYRDVTVPRSVATEARWKFMRELKVAKAGRRK